MKKSLVAVALVAASFGVHAFEFPETPTVSDQNSEYYLAKGHTDVKGHRGIIVKAVYGDRSVHVWSIVVKKSDCQHVVVDSSFMDVKTHEIEKVKTVEGEGTVSEFFVSAICHSISEGK